MIATTVVDEIRRLLLQGGLSQRKIASQLGVSRGTVNAIALGKRSDFSAPRRRENEGFVPPAGLHVRCNGCGCKVQMPCLACYIRARQAKTKEPNRPILPGQPVQGPSANVQHRCKRNFPNRVRCAVA
jgi:hypothetical protein